MVSWPKKCREAWGKGPNYHIYPIYRASQNLVNIHIETEIIRKVVMKHAESRRILKLMLKGCLLFFGVTLSLRCVHDFAVYVLKNDLVQESMVGTIGEHIELSSYVAGEARRQVRKGKLQIKQSIGQLCNSMGPDERDRLTNVMIEASEKCRLVYDLEECFLPSLVTHTRPLDGITEGHDEPSAPKHQINMEFGLANGTSETGTSKWRRRGMFDNTEEPTIIDTIIAEPLHGGKGKDKGRNRHTILHTKSQARGQKAGQPRKHIEEGSSTKGKEMTLHTGTEAQEQTEEQSHEIQEFDPVPTWFMTEAHGTTRKQTMTDVNQGRERGTQSPKIIRVIAYDESIAEAYSNAGKLALRFGQEFPLLAAKRICIEKGTASLIKLDAMLCIKCHYNDNDLINNQWYVAPVFTKTGIIFTRYVDGANVIVINRSNDQFIVNKHDTIGSIRNTNRHGHEVSLADHWTTITNQPDRGEGMISITIKDMKNKSSQLNVNKYHTTDELKRIVEKTEGIPTTNQAMIYNGERLVDKRTLSGSGVKNNSTLFLVINMS